MRRLIGVCGVLLVLAAVSASAGPVREVIRIHPRLGYEIDIRERDWFGLFEETDGFVRASILRDADDYILHLLYDRNGRRFLEERRFSAAELDALRQAIEAATRPTRTGNNIGRLRLVAHGTIYGLFVYGWGIVDVFDIESSRSRVGTWMLSGGSAFALSLYGTRGYDRGSGYAKMLTNASYAGLFYGIVPDLWIGDSTEIVNDVGRLSAEPGADTRAKRRHIGRMIALPVSVALMHALLGKRDVTDAEADLTFWSMWYGAAYGVAIPYLLGADSLDDKPQTRVYLSGASIGIPAFGYLGYRFARDRNLSAGRSWLLAFGSALGGYYGFSLMRIVDGRHRGDSDKPYVLAMALGAPIGATAFYRWTRDGEYSRGRALLMGLGAVAGGLLGSGLVYVASGTDDPRPYLIAAIVGSATTLWVTHRATRSSTP